MIFPRQAGTDHVLILTSLQVTLGDRLNTPISQPVINTAQHSRSK